MNLRELAKRQHQWWSTGNIEFISKDFRKAASPAAIIHLYKELDYLYEQNMSLRNKVDTLSNALQTLHDDIVEYQDINNLDGYNNHTMRLARAALRNSK